MGHDIDLQQCLLVEDQVPTRAWLREVLQQAFQPAGIVEHGSLKGAMQWIDQQQSSAALPWLAIVDLGLPDGSGVEIVRTLAAVSPSTRCVVATIYSDDAHLIEAITAGAQGYILKEEHREEIVATLRRIQQGEPPLSPSIAQRLLTLLRAPAVPTRDDADLTAREIETLTLIAQGMTVSEAAAKLALSKYTVAGYVKLIYQKLSVSNRAEATREAVRRGLA